MKKHSDLAFKIRKQDFTRCFMRKYGTIFLNTKQKIIYTEKRVNNFLNNAEQRIILCRMLEIVYAKNKFYECIKWIQIYSEHDVQRSNFINIEIDFINVEKQIRSF